MKQRSLYIAIALIFILSLVASLAIYFGACALLGRWYLGLAFVPLAAFVIYPYLKRVTPLCHFGVGAAKSLVTLRSWWASGLEMTAAGVVVGAATYAVGLLF